MNGTRGRLGPIDAFARVGLALIVGACARGAAVPSFVVRDSAGVQLIENGAPAWSAAEAWRVADSPYLRIGGENGEPGHELDGVTSAARLRDGRVVVANGGTSEVRVFDETGRLLATMGKPGEGPGEFRTLSRVLVLPGDTLLAIDGQLQRLTFFTPDGRLVRTAQLATAGTQGATPFLLLPDHTLLARPGFSFGGDTRSGVHRDTMLLVRYDLDGRFVDSAGRAGGRETYVYNEGGNALAMVAMFARNSYFAPAPDGYATGDGTTYAIEHRDVRGRLVRVLRAARPPRTVTANDVAYLREPDTEMAGDDAAFWQRVLAAMPTPDLHPAFAGLASDPTGHLWVRDYQFPDSAAHVWQVFRADGRWLGGITLPRRFRLLGIRHDEVIGIWQDDFDVEHVHAYQLRR